MEYPPGYVILLTDYINQGKFPNLTLDVNFHYTSEKTNRYNCLAWALGITNRWYQLEYFKLHSLVPQDYNNSSALGYAQILVEHYEFQVCDNGELEEGFTKVVLYEDNGLWTHIAIQLKNGHWSSKLGGLEDIEHYTVEAIEGGDYGYQAIFLKKSDSISK